ncbi:transporter substrate-binding domain-containing protein [Falsiroseomonas sp.]|uniref:transporter substrate-binding domain-containing protein n=1 Tax=Falsiroseomonas sp. TaxID=2870721 RepID=UPI003569C553
MGLLALSACDDVRFPRDPDGTLDHVLASGRMRVAAVDHVPWVIVREGEPPSGAEAELVEAFARSLGVAVEWRRAPAFKALEALQRGDADLAIGGFARQAVAAHKVASHTYAYFTEALVVAAAPGAPVPRELNDQQVHAAPALMAGGLIRERGGVPVSERTDSVRLIALPGWQFPARGLVPTGIVLRRDEHVVAVPRGENAWIMRLERFLRAQSGGMAARLQAHAP